MPAGATYESITSTTLGSNQATISFTNITGAYTDLIVVGSFRCTVNNMYLAMQLNNDTGSNYSTTQLTGNGSSATGATFANRTNINCDYGATLSDSTEFSIRQFHFNNYSNTSFFKSVLWRSDRAGAGTDIGIGLWRNTAAITTITFLLESGSFIAGSNVSLYGITAA